MRGRIIERGVSMTVRENVHQLVDTLPEERLADVLDYLAELQDGEEPLSAETEAGIEEGLEDLRHGRSVTLEEYRRTRRM
jgi:predicted transcriptional regulator